MLRPVPMTRALIVGPRDDLERTVDALYRLRLLHIVDHRAGEHDLEIGTPLRQAAQASEVLVKLRSIVNVLQVQESKSAGPLEPVSGDIRQKILSLELNISEEDSARKKVQSLLQDLTRRIEEITPFAQLPLALEDYRGYENLEILVGKVSRDPTGLESISADLEAFIVPGFVAVFVFKDRAPAMREFLNQFGFAGVTVPEGKGHPRVILAELLAEKERWEKRLEEINVRLETLRERYASFLAAAKAHLEAEVEKAEAPLRFAVTEHTFIAEGWAPSEAFQKLQAEFKGTQGLFIAELEHEEHSENTPSAPTLLRNVRPLKPFEMLVKLFSTPDYHEIDPTFTVAIVFPIFFGLMIGDAGYGLAWLLFGGWMLRTWAKEQGAFRDLVIAVVWGGFWSLIFGTFVFAEMFGIPFHALVGAAPGSVEAVDWSSILGFNIPIHAQLHKLEQVTDFIVLAIVAAYFHLALAFGIGFFNEIRHNRKHAVGKVAWLMILTGLFVIIIVRAARWPVGMGYAIWTGPLGWFPRTGFLYPQVGFALTNQVPWVAVGMLGLGIGLLLATEGALHIMEFFGLVANVVSYARLAAVGVAKAAMAFAFNTIALGVIFEWRDGGSVGFLAAGLFVAFLFHLIVFLLGAVTAAIQSIRLSYVEFFIKFFKGAGMAFRPFGERAKPEV
ncbi:MAG TPA: V-type ATP synthase subunit I [Thermoplasmata archaeon]